MTLAELKLNSQTHKTRNQRHILHRCAKRCSILNFGIINLQLKSSYSPLTCFNAEFNAQFCGSNLIGELL